MPVNRALCGRKGKARKIGAISPNNSRVREWEDNQRENIGIKLGLLPVGVRRVGIECETGLKREVSNKRDCWRW